MSVVAAPAGAAAKAGDLIKMDGLSTVYYLGADGQRYVFPNEKTYLSWYKDFSTVVTIAQSELEGYMLGGNVTVRPGTKLVKITTNPTVYSVEAGGNLRSIVSEANAIALWGANWAQRVIDVPDGFFTNYKIGSALTAGVYPAGSLVKASAGADVYYFDGTNHRKFASEAAFLANGFDFANVVTSAGTIIAGGTTITAAESTLTDTSSGAGGTPGAGTGLTVAISATTPASANVPSGSPVSFLKVNLTAANDGDVSISALTITSSGLGTATNIDGVTIYDGSTKVGSSKDVNSDKVATFNFSTPIKVTAGTTKTLDVKATIAVNGNYILGIASASGVTTNGASVSGSFPITGNTMTGVTATIGTVTMSSINTTAAPSTQFGADNVLLAEFNLAAANEPVIFSSARLKNYGTSGNLATNLKVVIDGTDVKTGVELVSGIATIDLGSYVIAKNDTVQVQVYGDMGIGRTGDTINLALETADDLVFTGKDLGYGILAAGTGTFDASGDGIVVTLTTGDFTLDMDKSTAGTPAKEVRAGDVNVALATIKFTTNGENATVQSITNTAAAGDFYISGTGLTVDEISNVRLIDNGSGATYDVTATASTTLPGWTLSITDDISLVQGVTKTFTLKADLSGSTSVTPIDNNDTLQVTLKSSAMTVKGDVSAASITNITPSSVSGSIATVKDASLSWTTQALTNKTVVPAANEVVYKATLEAGASSDVTLNSVKISTVSNAVDTFIDNNIARLDLVFTPAGGTAVTKSLSNSIVESTGSARGYINFSTLSGFTVPAGKTGTIELKALFATNFSTTTVGWSLGIAHASDAIVARDKDNNAVAESVVSVDTASRAMTLASYGTLKALLRTSDTKADVDTYLLAGAGTTAGRYVGEIVLTTANEPIKVKTLVLGQAGNATASDIKSVVLYDKNGAQVASVAPSADGYANFSTLNVTLPADQATSYFIGVVAKSMNADGDAEGTATFARNIQFNFASSTQLTTLGLSAGTAVTADGGNSGQAVAMAEDTSTSTSAVSDAGEYSNSVIKSKTTTVTGSVLTSVSSTLANGTLLQGTDQTIAKYTFTFDNGANRTAANEELKAELTQLLLTVATSTGISVTNVQAYIEGSASSKTSAVTGVSGLATIDLTTLTGTTELVDGVIVLVIEADIANSGTGAKYVQTKINSLTTDFTYNGNAGTGSDFANVRLDIVDVTGANLSATF